MRRVDRTGGKDHFAFGIRALERSAAFILDRDSPTASEDDAVDLRLDNHLQVGPLLCRPQIGASGAGSSPAAARLLAPTNTIAGPGRQIIYVLAVLKADLLTGLDYCRTERRP